MDVIVLCHRNLWNNKLLMDCFVMHYTIFSEGEKVYPEYYKNKSGVLTNSMAVPFTSLS